MNAKWKMKNHETSFCNEHKQKMQDFVQFEWIQEQTAIISCHTLASHASAKKFCKTCNVALCGDCAVSHLKHEMRPVQNMQAEWKEELMNMAKSLQANNELKVSTQQELISKKQVYCDYALIHI